MGPIVIDCGDNGTQKRVCLRNQLFELESSNARRLKNSIPEYTLVFEDLNLEKQRSS